VRCEIRDRLIDENDQALAASSAASKALAEVAGKLALARYKLTGQEKSAAKTEETLAALIAHRRDHGC
jgi:hypothetical protein